MRKVKQKKFQTFRNNKRSPKTRIGRSLICKNNNRLPPPPAPPSSSEDFCLEEDDDYHNVSFLEEEKTDHDVACLEKENMDNRLPPPPAPPSSSEDSCLEEDDNEEEKTDHDVACLEKENMDENDDDVETAGEDLLDGFMNENKQPLLPETAMRHAVAFLFATVNNAEPDEELWVGRNGIRAKVRRTLKLGSNTFLDNIFHAVVACKQEGTTYTGERAKHHGRVPIIAIDSYEAQIAADCVEGGFSILHAWTIVNQYRKENDLPSLTLAPVKNVIKRLAPLIKKIQKTRQGNKDEESVWCKARNNWDTQMLIRTGNLKGEQLDYLKIDGKLPKWFDPEQMPKLHHSHIVWWDETHKKCTIGGQGTTNDFYAKFPRDVNGKIDVKNGTYDETPIKKLNVKYEKEIRLCLGCAIVTDENGVESGMMAKQFDYMGKCVKSITDYNRLKRRLTAEVRKSTNTKRWTTSTRVPGSCYETDNVTVLANLAEKTREKLAKNNITTVGDLKSVTDEIIHLIDCSDDKNKRITKKLMIAFRKQASLAEEGEPPPPIDHRLAENPWLSKYGKDEWEEKERNAPSLANFVCITEIIEHIVSESARLHKGTKNEDTWMFYHDALTLMTAKKTIEWMKEKDYYKRWILPINGLHSDDKSLKYYLEKPVGNCPENMPLDTSLNNDIHEAVKRHVNATWEMHEDDIHKFSMSTPKRGVYAYSRVLENVPCSKRIVQDVKQVFKSMELVRLAKGVLVDGVGKRYGKRWASLGKKKLGGKRKRKLAPDDYDGASGGKWLHDHAKRGVAAKLVDSIRRAAGEVGTKAISDKTDGPIIDKKKKKKRTKKTT